MKLVDLKKDLQYKWKPQECKQYGATMVAYIDSRIVQDLLDEVCGQDKWQDRYHDVKGNVYCEIGIKCGEDWVWKGDCGSESNFEKEKGESSDAFKRAAVKWGIGRFLYSLGIVKLKAEQHTNKKYYPADDNGKILWDKAKLNEYCNKRVGKPAPKPAQPPTKPKPDEGVKKKYHSLPKMDDEEKAIMSNVYMLNKMHKPADMTPDSFKMDMAVNIYASLGKWPSDENEEDVTIHFVDDFYKEKK